MVMNIQVTNACDDIKTKKYVKVVREIIENYLPVKPKHDADIKLKIV